jgi:tetratricopeptide (TPR) repeat protein
VLALACALAVAGCATGSQGGGGSSGGADEKTVLLTRKGESSIQVTESEEDGSQVVRVKTVFRGEENNIVLNIDQPVYEVEIPLSLEQVLPQASAAAARGPEGQFQDLLIAQYLEKAQQAMMAGDYNGALRQVDTVLQVKPDHIQGHSMKGSIYYALGNYQLANEEWEYTLSLDPGNKEVLDFQAFLKNRASGAPPPLPGSPGQPAAGGAPTGRPSAAPPGTPRP